MEPIIDFNFDIPRSNASRHKEGCNHYYLQYHPMPFACRTLFLRTSRARIELRLFLLIRISHEMREGSGRCLFEKFHLQIVNYNICATSTTAKLVQRPRISLWRIPCLHLHTPLKRESARTSSSYCEYLRQLAIQVVQYNLGARPNPTK